MESGAGTTIRILVADDHAVVRKGLVMVLRLEPGFEVVGEAGNGQEALDLARSLQPDLLLLDRMMPEMNGVETAAELRRTCPDVKVLILTGAKLDSQVFDLLSIGVEGYVFKDIEPQELKEAIRSVMRGEAYLHPVVAQGLLDRMQARPRGLAVPQLTLREEEVLRWLATPNTYRQIGARLFVSEETIRSHAKSILGKLGQPNRAQAVLAAIRMGLIDPPEGEE